jgi:uncharacterized protein
MVERRTPYAVPAGTKFARYTIADLYLRFWLRFVRPHLAEIARRRGDLTAARIMRDWSSYRGRAVEPLVRDALEPTRIGFAGSIKWHEHEPFTAHERSSLAQHRAAVSRAADARLVIVTRTGVEPGVRGDLILGPDELLDAWA